MTDNVNINAYEGLTSSQQLNLFKNLYYNDGFSTEKGIIANAINDILPKYHKQQEEIKMLRTGCSSCCVVKAKSEKISELYEQIEYWQRGYNDLLRQIKEAQSEIESLKIFRGYAEKRASDYRTMRDKYLNAKSEAYKEFADKVVHDINAYCENIRTKPSVDGITGMKIANDLIYKRVNEMEGKNNDNS